MELTLAQLDYIDDYLIKNKVKYWDVRMELLDHISMEVQRCMSNRLTFEHALQEVHVAFGNKMRSKALSKDQTQWIFNESIYADHSGYNKIIATKTKELQLRIRRLYKKGFVGFFTSAASLCCYIVCIGLLVLCRESINPKVLSQLVVGLALLAVIQPFLQSGWHRLNYGKSVNLFVFGHNLLISSFGLLNTCFFLIQMTFYGAPNGYGFWPILYLLMLLIPLIVVQYQVYRGYLYPLRKLKIRSNATH